MERELAETEKNKEAFLADFTQVTNFLNPVSFVPFLIHHIWFLIHPFMIYHQEDYDDIVNGWSAKLKRSSAGEQKWGLFIATK